MQGIKNHKKVIHFSFFIKLRLIIIFKLKLDKKSKKFQKQRSCKSVKVKMVSFLFILTPEK